MAQQRKLLEARASAAASNPPLPEENAALNNNDEEACLVRLGDASIAAPFTSKMPSIRAVIDVIRQGRCTLLATLQMHQILALNCLISSYSLSVLYLDGVKYGDRQLTILGVLSTACFLGMSRGKPLPRLSPLRPPATVFHPSLFLSLAGQFVIHVCVLIYAARLAKDHLPADHAVPVDGKFIPNIINTLIFLVSCVQQVCVFAVNYKGRPFMQNVTENSLFVFALLFSFFGALILTSEAAPFLNEWMALVPLPTGGLRGRLMFALLFDVVATFSWDRLMVATFLPEVVKHMFLTSDDLKRLTKLGIWSLAILYLLLPSADSSRQN